MAILIKRLVILTMLACPLPVLGAELRTSREVALHGEDLAARLEAAVDELKREFTDQGCERISVAYWSDTVPLARLHVEVACRRSGRDEALAAVGARER